MQYFNIQEALLFATLRVTVEVQWLHSPAGFQHLAPFSSWPSVFVLRWSCCQRQPLLNAKALQRHARAGVLKLLSSAECYFSEAVLSPHIISSPPGITALSAGEPSFSLLLFRRL